MSRRHFFPTGFSRLITGAASAKLLPPMTDVTHGERLVRIATLSAELNSLCQADPAPRARCLSILAELLELLTAESAYERSCTAATGPHLYDQVH